MVGTLTRELRIEVFEEGEKSWSRNWRVQLFSLSLAFRYGLSLR